MKWSEVVGEAAAREVFADLKETSTAGGTCAGNVATTVGGLGAGFDPNGDHGIYQSKRRKRKAVLLRR